MKIKKNILIKLSVAILFIFFMCGLTLANVADNILQDYSLARWSLIQALSSENINDSAEVMTEAVMGIVYLNLKVVPVRIANGMLIESAKKSGIKNKIEFIGEVKKSDGLTESRFKVLKDEKFFTITINGDNIQIKKFIEDYQRIKSDEFVKTPPISTREVFETDVKNIIEFIDIADVILRESGCKREDISDDFIRTKLIGKNILSFEDAKDLIRNKSNFTNTSMDIEINGMVYSVNQRFCDKSTFLWSIKNFKTGNKFILKIKDIKSRESEVHKILQDAGVSVPRLYYSNESFMILEMIEDALDLFEEYTKSFPYSLSNVYEVCKSRGITSEFFAKELYKIDKAGIYQWDMNFFNNILVTNNKIIFIDFGNVIEEDHPTTAKVFADNLNRYIEIAQYEDSSVMQSEYIKFFSRIRDLLNFYDQNTGNPRELIKIKEAVSKNSTISTDEPIDNAEVSALFGIPTDIETETLLSSLQYDLKIQLQSFASAEQRFAAESAYEADVANLIELIDTLENILELKYFDYIDEYPEENIIDFLSGINKSDWFDVVSQIIYWLKGPNRIEINGVEYEVNRKRHNHVFIVRNIKSGKEIILKLNQKKDEAKIHQMVEKSWVGAPRLFYYSKNFILMEMIRNAIDLQEEVESRRVNAKKINSETLKIVYEIFRNNGIGIELFVNELGRMDLVGIKHQDLAMFFNILIRNKNIIFIDFGYADIIKEGHGNVEEFILILDYMISCAVHEIEAAGDDVKEDKYSYINFFKEMKNSLLSYKPYLIN